MKRYNIKTITCAVILGFGLTACSDYLDHPTEDNYDTSNYYSNDAQCRAGVNYLYNSPLKSEKCFPATIIGEVLLI